MAGSNFEKTEGMKINFPITKAGKTQVPRVCCDRDAIKKMISSYGHKGSTLMSSYVMCPSLKIFKKMQKRQKFQSF